MIKKLSEKYHQWNYFRKSRKTQNYRFGDIRIKVFPSVFSPEKTRTTELFADYLLDQPWEEKQVLELGAGSGIIAFLLASKGAKVTASDVNPQAIRGLRENKETLGLNVDVIESDLFNNLNKGFDYVLINPPFFDKKPENVAELAWYCGENFEFFEELFSQFSRRNFEEEMWMILSHRADFATITSIISKNRLDLKGVVTIENKRENHLLLKIGSK